MKSILKYFLRGLLIFVPVGLTIFILVSVFTSLDKLFSKLLPFIRVPGLGLLLGLLVTIGGICLIGLFASNFVGKKLFGIVEKVFTKLPLVKLLYGSIKDIVEAFAGEDKKFDKPVIVSLTGGDGPKVAGFITSESLENFGLDDYAAVYLPQSYNFAGNVLLFKKDSIQPLDIDSSKAMSFIVSGGVSGK